MIARGFLVCVFVFAVAGQTWAQGSPSSRGKSADAPHPAFSEVDKRLIRDFFRGQTATTVGAGRSKSAGKGRSAGKGKSVGKGKSNHWPPGLAKRNDLPPGLAMQRKRFGTLPPGLAKRNLPGDLSRRLGKPPPGHERIIAGQDVLLVERATGLIIDILEGMAN